jgi:predicted  nucleic acid-binding Zn-ribbon protein
LAAGNSDPLHDELSALANAIEVLTNQHTDLVTRVATLEQLVPNAAPAGEEAYSKLHSLVAALYGHLGLHQPGATPSEPSKTE